MPTVGTDCHLTLQHSAVNSGTDVGFLVRHDKRGPVIRLQKPRADQAVWADQGPGRQKLTIELLALPRMLGPDGSTYALTPTQVRTLLNSFWTQTTPLTLTTWSGAQSVMWDTIGIDEEQYGDGSLFRLHLLVVV